MKIKIVSLLIILLFLAGCTFQHENTTNKFKIHYLTGSVTIFDLNQTDALTDTLVNNHFNIPKNGTTLFLNLTWDASQEPKLTGNGTQMFTHNFTYHLEFFPPDGTVCYPGNNITNGTDLKKRTGNIKVVCHLNNTPGNTTFAAHNMSEAEESQVSGYNGTGLWHFNMSHHFKISDMPPCPRTHWTLTAELEQYYYIVDKTK